MVFNDKKTYFKERKTSTVLKRKIEQDTTKKNIKDFSYEDIAKPTQFSRKVKNKTLKSEKKVIPTYNTTKSKTPVLTTYGTFLEKDDKLKSNKKRPKTAIERHWQTKEGLKTKKYKKSKYLKNTKESTTLDEYITKQYLLKKELQRKEKVQKAKEVENTQKFQGKKRKSVGIISSLKRRNTSQKENRQNGEDTIDILLSKIPSE